MALEVIGAGFGRTGTESMKLALEALGLGPCHHMKEVLPRPEQVALWRSAARGATPDWEEAFAGYKSALDWPSAYFWRELSACPASIGVRMIGQGVFGGRLDDRDHAIAIYERNTAEVQAAFPPDRLLTYSLGDGWAPLCAFLGKPVPDAPFPHSNTSEDFEAMMSRMSAESRNNGNP